MKESESKGCCDTHQQFLKIANTQRIANATYQLTIFIFSSLPAAFFETTYAGIPLLRKETLQSNALLRGQSLPLFVLNCHFRI